MGEIEVRGVSGTPGDGPYIVLEARFDGECVSAVRATCNGCATAVRLCDVLCALLPGRLPSRIESITERDLELLVPGIPEGKEFYRGKAVEALRDLCADIENRQVKRCQ